MRSRRRCARCWSPLLSISFAEAERQFCEWLAPHLWATWTANWIAQMDSIRVSPGSGRSCHAISDQRAVLHSAEPRFVELIRSEWPQVS